MDIASFILGRKNGRDSVKTQEKTVTPGESEIVVIPDTGFDALSKVIVEAVESSGGSGGSFTLKTDVFKATDVSMTVEHNCGVVPDIILFVIQDISSGGTGLLYSLGFSSAMLTALGGGYLCETSGVAASKAYNVGMEEQTATKYGQINSVTETSFGVGGSAISLEIDKHYSWYAICGIC